MWSDFFLEFTIITSIKHKTTWMLTIKRRSFYFDQRKRFVEIQIHRDCTLLIVVLEKRVITYIWDFKSVELFWGLLVIAVSPILILHKPYFTKMCQNKSRDGAEKVFDFRVCNWKQKMAQTFQLLLQFRFLLAKG